MKRRDDIKTVTFEAEYGFMVDVVDNKDWINHEPVWDVWLYRDSIGYKMYMFGFPKDQTPDIEEVIEITERNLPEYYPDYDEQFCQYDEVNRGYEEDYDYEEDDDDCICCPVCGSKDVELIEN